MTEFEFAIGSVDVRDRTTLANGAPFFTTVTLYAWRKGEDPGPLTTLLLGVRDGRPVLRRFAVEGAEITATTIRAVPVGRLVESAIAYATQIQPKTLRVSDLDPDAGSRAVGARRNRSMTPELLSDVALVVHEEIDRSGQLHSRPEARQAVMRRFHCSARTASRYIAMASERGYIRDRNSKGERT